MSDERDYEYKIFHHGECIEYGNVTRQDIKAMLLGYYAHEKDVEEILSVNNQEKRLTK